MRVPFPYTRSTSCTIIIAHSTRRVISEFWAPSWSLQCRRMASSSISAKPSVGILSMGDMGTGVAKLLRAHEFNVFTVSAGRSERTIERIKAASVTDLPSDEALVAETDIVLSIVPPRDAFATARRVYDACKSAGKARREKKGPAAPITFVDLNAISSRTARNISQIFGTHVESHSIVRRLSRRLSSGASNDESGPAVPIAFVDGGIIGGPPSKQTGQWKSPSMPISGPVKLPDEVMKILNMKSISDEIGTASALKACFASLTKGFTALSILSFTTAETVGVLPELQAHLKEFAPSLLKQAENGLTSMPPKAYRWIDEMKQIGETFSGEGGFGQGLGGQAVYEGIADIYKLVSEDTVLGQEKTNKRKRGTTAEDVAKAVREGIEQKRLKKEGGNEKLEMTWRGSWS